MKQTVMINLLWWKRRSALAITIAVLMTANLLCDETSAATICGSGANQAALRSLSLKTERTVNTFIQFLGNVHTMIKPKKKCDDVCVSAGCIRAASMVLENMDTNVDPCDDFYKFACGGFLNNTIIPENKDAVKKLDPIKDKVREELRAMIESKIEDNEPKPFKLIKNFYKSCMNTKAIEAEGLEPLKRALKTLGGWPVVDGDKWNELDFNWTQSMYNLRDAGFSPNIFIGFRVDTDPKNSTKRVIHLDGADTVFAPEFLSEGLDNKTVKAYYSYMVGIAEILGANATIELEKSLLFEMELANISQPNEELPIPMSISELERKYPSVGWLEYIRKMLPSSISIDEKEITIVKSPSYLSRLEKLMAKTLKRVQANFIMWYAVAHSVSHLNKDIREREFALKTELGLKIERPSRGEECVHDIGRITPLRIIHNAMYVRKYSNKEAKHNVEEMAINIQKQLNIIISKAEWMDNVTRQSALDKAAAMSSYVGYADELLDDNKLEELCAKLELTGGSYFDSQRNLSFFAHENSVSELRKPVNKTHWSSFNDPSPTDVIACYSQTWNRIQFSAGIIQGKFYSNDRPRYMNYGAIGHIIGHELHHGFAPRWRRYDKDGNRVNWTPSTEQEYLKRVECFIHQYGNYTAQEVGLNLNGSNTRNEDFSDNGGIKVAYLAYNQWVDRNSPEDKLPGLDYTPRQMFWISTANTLCSIYKPEALKDYIETNPHSPDKFRLLGMLSNMPEFSKDFNCPIGSKMNPKNKCSIW